MGSGGGLPWGLNVLKTLVNPKTYNDPASFMTGLGTALMPHGWMVGVMPIAINLAKKLFGGGRGRDHIGYHLVANPKFKVLGEDSSYIYYRVDPTSPGAWANAEYLTEFRIDKRTGNIEYKKTREYFPWTRVNMDALPEVLRGSGEGDTVRAITPDTLALLEKEIGLPEEIATLSWRQVEALKGWRSKYLAHGYHTRNDSYWWAPFEGQMSQPGSGVSSDNNPALYIYDPRGYSRALYYDVLVPAGKQGLWGGDPPPMYITPDMYEWSGKWYASGAPKTVPEIAPYYLKFDKNGKVKYAYGAIPKPITVTGGQTMGSNKNMTTTTSQSATMPSWGQRLWDYYMSLLLGGNGQPGVYGTAQEAYSQYLQQLAALDPRYGHVAEQLQRQISAMDRPPVAVSLGGQHIADLVPYARTMLPYLSGYAGLVKQYEDLLAKLAAVKMTPTLAALSAAQVGFPVLESGMVKNTQQSLAIPKSEPSTAQQIAGWVNVLGGLSKIPGIGDALEDLGSWAWGEVKNVGKGVWNWMTSFFD